MWNLKTKQSKKKNKLTDTENRLMVARGRWWGMRKLGERDQKVQISNYKINMSKGYKAQHGTIINNTVLQT